jgi:hypothetical protein
MGMRLNLGITFHPQTNEQIEGAIQTLEGMMRACVMDLKGSWLQYISLREIVYHNNYHVSIKMTSYEALLREVVITTLLG